MFDKKGYIVVDKDAKSEDEILEITTEAGADDMPGRRRCLRDPYRSPKISKP